MESYKEINKELIDANREMRLHIAAYQKELVQLRAELMEQHRWRVESERDFRARVVSMLTRNFRDALREVDPKSSLLEFLCADIVDDESRQYAAGSQHGDATISRRSSVILSEFRRSSAVHRRQSVVQVSPTRRRSAEMSTSSISSTEDISVSSTENIDGVENSEGNEENVVPQLCLHSIKEVYEGVADDALKENLSRQKQTLSQKLIADKPRVLKQINNRITEEESHILKGTDHVVVRRGKQRKCPLESQEELVEVARLMQSCADDETLIAAKFPNFSSGANSEADDTNGSLSMALSELTMGNFIEAPCSTPCNTTQMYDDTSRKQSLRSQYREISIANSLTVDSLETTSTRPSRRCAPKSLVEPKLHRKLRNEGATKTRKKGKK